MAQMLQRTFGNRAVTHLLPRSPDRFPVQAKLTITPSGDQHEQEVQAMRTLGNQIVQRAVMTADELKTRGGKPSRKARINRSTYVKIIGELKSYGQATNASKRFAALEKVRGRAQSWLANHHGTDNATKTRRAALQDLLDGVNEDLQKGPGTLSPGEREVFWGLSESAEKESKSAKATLNKKWTAMGLTATDLTEIKQHLRLAEVTVNFKPEKDLDTGQKTIDAFAAATRYMNTFERGGQSGGADTGIGGGRDVQEQKIFGHKPFKATPTMAELGERPKYAGLNVVDYATGAATGASYGESVLVLKQSVKERATLTAADTFAVQSRKQVGTFEHLDNVILRIINTKATQTSDGGQDLSSAKAYFEKLLNVKRTGTKPPGIAESYLEVQMYGSIDLATDIDHVRASFKDTFGTPVGTKLRNWAVARGFPLKWAYTRSDPPLDEPTGGPKLTTFEDEWTQVEGSTKRLQAIKNAWTTLNT